jgi:heme-degrading monooxygenase HmoA
MIANTPRPPYYAVIFTTVRTEITEDYAATAERMVQLAKEQPGYLGHESARDNLGITVSYWDSLEAIKNWKQQSEHVQAQENGRTQYYAAYTTRICLVERDYHFEK